MSSLVDTIRSKLGPAEIAQISQQLGVDPAAAQQAIDSALPAVVGGMEKHAASISGASQTQDASAMQGGGLLDTITNAIGGAQTGGGGGLLSSIFGHHADAVHENVQQSTGLDPARTRQLLTMLAPIVLGMIARHRQSADPNAPQTPSSGLGGILGNILGG